LAEGTKSFVFNCKSDWEYGTIVCGATISESSVEFDQPGGMVVVTPCLDSGIEDTVWHRLRLKFEMSENSKINLFAFSSNSPRVSVGNSVEPIDFDAFLRKSENSRANIFGSIGARKFENPEDILLFGIRGRYLWICIEPIMYDPDSVVRISEMRVEFPRTSFVGYLPEVYQHTKEDSFLSRFVSVFQSIYVDMEQKIDCVPLYFEPLKNDFNFLSWIASWLSIKDIEIWKEEKLRLLIAEAIEIFKIKGTKRSLVQIIERYVGAKPIIVEQFEVAENDYYKKDRKTIENLYGDSSYVFTVLIGEEYIRETDEFANLLKIIGIVAPVDSICNLVVIRRSIFLGFHCYIGINSYISRENYSLAEGSPGTGNGIMLIG
jgi:phage tail-like protein